MVLAMCSEKVYEAVIYVRSLNKDGVIFTNILCSKSKVSPLNKKTLAKLELCASIMLAELINHIRTKIDYEINNVFYYINLFFFLYERSALQKK